VKKGGFVLVLPDEKHQQKTGPPSMMILRGSKGI
jgi:hypothetical protein